MDVVVVALLACGAAGVALDPRNRTSWLLTALGVLAAVGILLEPTASAHDAPSVSASLLRYVVEATYLPATVVLVVLQLVYPHGRFERAWHRRASLALLAASVAAPLALLLGSPTLDVGGDSGTTVDNMLATPGLAPLARIGAIVVAAEPLWFFVGFVGLLLRFRAADRERRRELWPLLGGLLALSLFLVPVVAETLGGPEPPQPAFQVLFQTALAVLPIVLLAGISRRTRLLARDLAASRERLVVAEDVARRRLERDLHDGVQQHLVALLSLTELASRQARAGSANLGETLDDVRDQLTDTIDDLRELVAGFRPPVLEDSGVAAALESRLRRLPGTVSLDVLGDRGRRWSAPAEAAAYFVACEAVSNALKHAPGSAVRVSVGEHDGGLAVEVADDGPGLGTGRGGSGLVGMRDRVDSTGGRFSVGPGPAGGTVVRASFA